MQPSTNRGPQRWLHHTRMTDPGPQDVMLGGLPVGIGELCRIVQGNLLHLEWIGAYGLSEQEFAAPSRETLPLSDRLQQFAGAGVASLLHRRPPQVRSPGTCRDFALMLCGLLRHEGIPARVRCGFAAYFHAGRWEDHWICECWSPAEQRWRRIDPQLDDVLSARLGIDFDPVDLPDRKFLSAGEAWLGCRSGQDDATVFGHGTARGMWFIRVNVMRDHLVLNGSEVSGWDSWRDATAGHQALSEDDLRGADAIAADPAQAPKAISPPWIG
jgi:hypothetical protein